MFNSIAVSNVGTFPQVINDRYYLTPQYMGSTNSIANNNSTHNNNNASYGITNVQSMSVPTVHNPNYNIPYHQHIPSINSIDFNYVPPVTNIYPSSVAATVTSSGGGGGGSVSSNSSSSSSTPIVTHINNYNNYDNENDTTVRSVLPHSMINPFQRKYETMIPASKPIISSNNIENDIKSRLNASALKFLSGSGGGGGAENKMDSTMDRTYQSSLASSPGSYSSLPESYYHYNNGIPLHTISNVNVNASRSHHNSITSIDNSIHIKQEGEGEGEGEEFIYRRRDVNNDTLSIAKETRKRSSSKKRGKTYTKRKMGSRAKNNDVLEHCVYLELRRRHICQICNKGFTTSGHLARHNRIHTGERNHICPFKGCHQKFSRQDNCLQHYKTHLKRLERRADPISGETVYK